MIDIDERQRFALDLVLRAGQLALDMRRNLAPIEAKTPIDFCTEAAALPRSLFSILAVTVIMRTLL